VAQQGRECDRPARGVPRRARRAPRSRSADALSDEVLRGAREPEIPARSTAPSAHRVDPGWTFPKHCQPRRVDAQDLHSAFRVDRDERPRDPRVPAPAGPEQPRRRRRRRRSSGAPDPLTQVAALRTSRDRRSPRSRLEVARASRCASAAARLTIAAPAAPRFRPATHAAQDQQVVLLRESSAAWRSWGSSERVGDRIYAPRRTAVPHAREAQGMIGKCDPGSVPIPTGCASDVREGILIRLVAVRYAAQREPDPERGDTFGLRRDRGGVGAGARVASSMPSRVPAGSVALHRHSPLEKIAGP
jgi:hypothetical protein